MGSQAGLTGKWEIVLEYGREEPVRSRDLSDNDLRPVYIPSYIGQGDIQMGGQSLIGRSRTEAAALAGNLYECSSIYVVQSM